MLDVGAGTGYYLAHLMDRGAGRGVALDVSAAACRRAARAHERLGSVVADAWTDFSLGDGGFDAVLCAFAPRNAAEFARVLTAAGRLVVATRKRSTWIPCARGWACWTSPPTRPGKLAQTLGSHFTLGEQQQVRYEVAMDRDLVTSVIGMGPNAFHLSTGEITRRVAELDLPTPVTVAVDVTVGGPASPEL